MIDWLARHASLFLPKDRMPSTVMSVAEYGRAPSEHTCSGADTVQCNLILLSQENSKHFSGTEDAPMGGAIIKHNNVTSQIDRDYRRLFHVLRTVY